MTEEYGENAILTNVWRCQGSSAVANTKHVFGFEKHKQPKNSLDSPSFSRHTLPAREIVSVKSPKRVI